MFASMDLNASPEPEEEEVFPEPQSEDDNVHEERIEYNEHVDHGGAAVSTARRVSFCLIVSQQDSF